MWLHPYLESSVVGSNFSSDVGPFVCQPDVDTIGWKEKKSSAVECEATSKRCARARVCASAHVRVFVFVLPMGDAPGMEEPVQTWSAAA